MNKHDQNGSVNSLLFPVIIITVLFLASAGFAGWAYTSRQDYKNNVDAKVASAVTVAKQIESTSKDKQFAELEKQPLRTYNGPQAFGSLSIQYPKTWSGYVDDSGVGSLPVNGYFYPGIVPSLTSQNSHFALRVQVLPQAYDSVVNSFSSFDKAGTATISPFSLVKVPSVVGIRVDGSLTEQKTGSMVVLPLRDKTVEISTESTDFMSDFNNNILPNLTFVP